ncbi:hypothetical protein KO481_22890 [Nocardia sp. NEAU-G5]|uniref:AbiEi antitoxin C-terminal domain-containing protein n=1 Tax=Nocardia albiluteola TaxID=2842303 RepID=A0ABS6B244_9NOCA|nr:hypothetical protein [Nocardia albiluteola]MBU3064367.1 hypothetical protein [Nocardia albiluteola]
MTVRIRPRDIVSLTVLSEHYGAPLDLVADMHGVSMRSARKLALRWREAGLIGPLQWPIPGPGWVVPTTVTAEKYLGFQVRHWAPTLHMVDHLTSVLRVRLALVGLDSERWISERTLRHDVGPTRFGVARPHIHDGRYRKPEGGWWAVEVELTPKTVKTVALASVLGAHQAAERGGCEGLVYYCRGERVKNVIREAAQGLDVTTGPDARLEDLDKFLAKPRAGADSRPALRLVVGGDWTQP